MPLFLSLADTLSLAVMRCASYVRCASYTGMEEEMPAKQQPMKSGLLRRMAEVLAEEDGWTVSLDDARYHRLDAVADKGDDRLAIVLKVQRDARRSILRSKLAEAMLAASAATVGLQDGHGWRPVAVVGAPRLTDEMVAQLREDFRDLREGLPGADERGLGWGVIDATGRVLLEGPGLHVDRAPSREPPRPPRVPEPFTDRGQWVLKLLLSPLLPASGLGFSPASFPSANALARAAEVSVSTAASVVRYLREKGHLSDAEGLLELHRLPELLELWKHRTPQPTASVEAEFRLPTGDPEGRLREGLLKLRGDRAHAARAFAPRQGRGGPLSKQPRACLSAVSACRALGVSVVEGAVPSLYVDDLSPRVLQLLGLRKASTAGAGDVRLQVPSAPEAVFRAAVDHDGVACTDVLQCWLDMRPGVPRHAEQAMALEAGALAAVLKGKAR